MRLLCIALALVLMAPRADAQENAVRIPTASTCRRGVDNWLLEFVGGAVGSALGATVGHQIVGSPEEHSDFTPPGDEDGHSTRFNRKLVTSMAIGSTAGIILASGRNGCRTFIRPIVGVAIGTIPLWRVSQERFGFAASLTYGPVLQSLAGVIASGIGR